MSLLHFDGFDDYGANNATINTALLASGYSQSNTIRSFDANPIGFGRSMGVYNSSGSGPGTGLYKPMGDIAKPIVGFHFMVPNETYSTLIQFANGNLLGSVTGDTVIMVNEQRGITVRDAAGNTVFGASDGSLISPGVWYFLEVMADYATDEVTVRLNEDTIIPAAPIVTARNTVNLFRFTGRDNFNGTFKQFDNLYILDGASGGAPFTDFLGEIAVITCRPDSDATPNEMTVNGSAEPEHYKVVDDDTINDADYLSADTDGLEEWFTVTDLPIDTLSVYAVAAAPRLRKGAGPANYRTMVKVGGAGVPQVNADRASSATFSTVLDIMDERPGGGTWSVADVNDLYIGIETRP